MLQCNAGFIPLGKTLMTCLETQDWDVAQSEFRCIEPIGLIIGGIAQNYNYLDEVEVLAPGFDCANQGRISWFDCSPLGAQYFYADTRGKKIYRTNTDTYRYY